MSEHLLVRLTKALIRFCFAGNGMGGTFKLFNFLEIFIALFFIFVNHEFPAWNIRSEGEWEEKSGKVMVFLGGSLS